MKKLCLFLVVALLSAACHHHGDDDKRTYTQSVLVYCAGDNNLSNFITYDIKQMMTGSKEISRDCTLLLFIDKAGIKPYMLKVANGDTVRVKTFEEELKTSDPDVLQTAMRWMKDNYKAKSYGLVLWGHANGPLIEGNTAQGRRRAYGYDETGGEQWMDIPDMARALEQVFSDAPLRFIFADCCCFQSVESAYELRHCADYIISSAAEIPGEGAPYQTVIPALFNQSDDFYRFIVDAYHAQESFIGRIPYNMPLSVVKTSAMDDLAEATRVALAQSLQPSASTEPYPDTEGLIYYYCYLLFDLNDFMLRHASADVYNQWKRSFDAAIVYKVMEPLWLANSICYTTSACQTFRHFEVTEERYGGISMYIPQAPNTVYLKCLEETWNLNRFNNAIQWRTAAQRQLQRFNQLQWYQAAGLDKFGW